ncbi:hypothetical protein JTE90_027386 [Oedothorax gibbosus]|uniref:Secreted protein n=1 Tax=Oedothorax gibbosus TaxID=931172 RepID=A0AAV6W1E0_9ARAC|nr:hypothetical protein JTE90_027386 [Oedothorax gibbosus]
MDCVFMILHGLVAVTKQTFGHPRLPERIASRRGGPTIRSWTSSTRTRYAPRRYDTSRFGCCDQLVPSSFATQDIVKTRIGNNNEIDILV